VRTAKNNDENKVVEDANERLLKPYDPSATEDRIYELWEKGGFFNPDICVKAGVCDPDAEPFSIALPPPNVTGTLHMGHAAMLAIEDILVRYNRMRGKKTLWLPGTDHAAIATQSKVEGIIYKKEGKRRHDLGREEFLKRVRQFAQESHDTIVNQVKKMGSSVDWSREAYTLDEKRNLAVRTAFKRMYDDGLIERGYRIVNWCPNCYSTLSDDEVAYQEGAATLYTFKYSKDFPFEIATTRPETKLGDTAVAVHPNDTRYREYIGQTFTADLGHGPQEIKVIGDEHVEPEFGTGALGVTPAHSMTDYEMAQKNNLPIVKVIDERGRMTKEAGSEYEGLKVKEAREKFVIWLKENDLMTAEEKTPQNLSVCYRCGKPIEPLPSRQWFVMVDKPFTITHSNIKGVENESTVTLKELMLKVVENGQIVITPDRFEKVYRHWIDNLHDWCVSRQIWFGHQIPVWYKGALDTTSTEDTREIYVGTEPPQGTDWRQDPDTLDTWFSAGLWTFSTLGWPDNAKTARVGAHGPENDFANFHPTSVLETGYDILFFWVARMILMTTYMLGDIPFENVYLHGLVRDDKGRKMSKSLGNIIDPLDMIATYGADATRMSLIIGTTPGNDMKLSEDKVRAYKRFTNKLWNITRFVAANTANFDQNTPIETAEIDKKLLEELSALTREVTGDIEKFRFYLAGEKLYRYAWHRFADEIIEESKARLAGGDENNKRSTQYMLRTSLLTIIKLLHPFMPFVTEEIWGILKEKDEKPLIVTPWPETR